MKAARWGDNDVYLGPFTWAYSKSYPHWAVVLRSRGDDDDSNSGQCTLRISLRKATLIIVLPHIVRPWREKVYPGWDAETVKRLGRDWYWNLDPRQYGFSLHNAGDIGGSSHLSLYYGRTGGSACDSRTQQQWGCFLPWTQWRHVRHSLYGLKGEEFYTEHEWQASLRAARGERYEIFRQWEKLCPVVRFKISDFDGAEIIATTRIEERAWLFGTGWFKWLSYFRRPIIRRSLDIDFSGETGPEKGSWKGGTVGTGIDMLPDELHEAAFRRYCNEEHRSKYRKYRVTFISLYPQQRGGE